MTPWKWLLLAAVWVALADTSPAQRAAGWRVYRMADGLPESACTTVSVGLNGKILVTHLTPEFVTELDGYTVKRLPSPRAQNGRVSASPGGQLWAVTPGGLKEWKENTWVLHPIPKIIDRSRAAPNRPVPFLPIQQGRVLFLLPDGLLEFNANEVSGPRTTVVRQSAQMQIGAFSDMCVALDGGLWITGTRGLARAPGPIRHLQPDDPWQQYLPPASSEIQNLRQPHEGAGGGVTLLADSIQGGSAGVCFDGRQWMTLPAPENTLRFWREPDQTFRALTKDSLLQWQDGWIPVSDDLYARQYFDAAIEPGGAVWLATSDGLYRLAPTAWAAPTSLAESAPRASRISALTGDSSGRLWFISQGKLYCLQTNSAVSLPEAAGSFRNSSLMLLKDGSLLLAPGDGLFQVQTAGGEVRRVRTHGAGRITALGTLKDGGVCIQTLRPGESPVLETYDGTRFQPFPVPLPEMAGDGFSVLFAAQNGDLWLGAADGVACNRDGKWQTFVSADKTTPENAVAFVELADGRIWCAAPERIWSFDGRNWSLVRSGFDGIHHLLRAADGSVWVSSNLGLHRFLGGAWIELGTDEGLPSAAVHAVYEDSQRRLWAATARGLSCYMPEADVDPPEGRIQNFGDENQKLFEGATLKLLFNGRDKWKFTPPGRLLYSYRLDQHDWSPFEDVHGVSFPDLPAGRHYVQLRAMDRNGNVGEPRQFEFAVVLPWHQETRLLVIALAGLAVALFFAALAYNRHRRLLRGYAEVERQVAARTHELEIANRELLHSQKMNALGTLAAGIAHDFNNILSIIKGSAQIIEENLDNPQKINTRVDRIKTVVEQGSGIVKAMLGFSRDTDDQAGLCNPNEVVRDTVRLLGDRFLREVEVRFEPGADVPEVPVSKNFIQQILLNFIFNAAESMASRRDKHVLLTTRAITVPPANVVLPPAAGARYVAIAVRDAGCGIPPANMPRIFEPFFTTKSLSARRGTGLGLSMVYELAKKVKAGLAVESVVDEGSVFTLILPAREATA